MLPPASAPARTTGKEPGPGQGGGSGGPRHLTPGECVADLDSPEHAHTGLQSMPHLQDSTPHWLAQIYSQQASCSHHLGDWRSPPSRLTSSGGVMPMLNDWDVNATRGHRYKRQYKASPLIFLSDA